MDIGADKIKIRDLEVYGHHGVYREENVLGQKFLISAVLYADLQEAGRLDDITRSINYAQAAHFIDTYMKEHTCKLIEAAACRLAEGLLLKFPAVREVELEVKKPWAPILLPLETVSVEIRRGWRRAYLGLGSNMGDKEKNLTEAVRLLGENERCRVLRVSDFIVTKPVGDVEQDDFLNGALVLDTLLEPEELLELAGEIEKKLKRVRSIHWGPRTIDLDILLYEDRVIETDRLTIPHPELHKRMFVLEPLSRIAPYAIHPVFRESILKLRDKMGVD